MPRSLVVNFHGIGPIPDHVEDSERLYWCEDIDRFRAILDSVVEAKTRYGVSIDITFDDGNHSDVAIALPELQRRQLQARFFVCAGRIGADRYLASDDLAKMTAAGMSIGSHGWSHVDWRKVPDDVLGQEIDAACDAIAKEAGQPVDEVAIPFGSYNARVVRRLGRFRTVFTSDGGFARSGARFQPRQSFRTDWAPDHVIEQARLLPSMGALRHATADLKNLLKRMR